MGLGILVEKSYTQKEISLITAVIELEQLANETGWDQSPQLYALVKTREIIDKLTFLTDEEHQALTQTTLVNPEHLFSIYQDQMDNPIEKLHTVYFDEEVAGVALVMERIMIPADAETAIPEEEQARDQYLLSHHQREDIRMAVGVLRSGETWCAIRSRSHDDDKLVAQGPTLIPEVIKALAETLKPENPA